MPFSSRILPVLTRAIATIRYQSVHQRYRSFTMI